MGEVNATILLADSAEAVNGKVYALGLGWSQTSAPTTPMAVVMLFKVPWTDAKRKIAVRVELLDADGHPVEFGEPDGLGRSQTLAFDAELEVPRPVGVPHGTPIDASSTAFIPPLPLQPGRAYEFRMTVDGQNREEWSAAFNTRP